MLAGVFALAVSAAQTAAVNEAATALQRGDFAGAEQKLRAEARAHPDDAWTLSLLGYSLDNQKRSKEAEEFHQRAVQLAPASPEVLNNYGTHLWIEGDYAKAETVFAQALAAAPTYFNVLYNLGVMSTYAGHYDRAREALRGALAQQPKNVDVLYRLASVEEQLRQWEDAAGLLAQAGALDPKRADVQKLLAVTVSELGALPDAAAAWDRYLALEPNDDVARRERAYTSVKMGMLEEGIAGIEQFLKRHPDDKVAHFELAQAQRSLNPSLAIDHFDRALELDTNYAAARAARGSLYYQNGNFAAAVKDLETAAKLEPDNAVTLDRLGQTYQELERPFDAVRVLRRAAELSPEDSKVLLHFGRALADAGETAESKAVMDRFRQLGPEQKVVVPEGLVSYLSLTPDQRRSDYRARVEKSVREHPTDVAAQLAWLKVVTEGRDAKRAAVAAKCIGDLKPAGDVLAAAGHVLLEAGFPALAKSLLQQSGVPSFDLAVATFRDGPPAATAKAALEVMARVGGRNAGGDYYLARARMLESAGRPDEASADREQALRIFAGAARSQPDRREILLMQATTLEALRRTDEALALLKQVATRWPEWSSVWAARGIVLAMHQRYPEASQALEAASALGSHCPETIYFLAKTYDALGRKAEMQKERERLRALSVIPEGAEESWYVDRFLEGGLLKP
jgi:tetratricopeptide (TPR) repeat protein